MADASALDNITKSQDNAVEDTFNVATDLRLKAPRVASERLGKVAKGTGTNGCFSPVIRPRTPSARSTGRQQF